MYGSNICFIQGHYLFAKCSCFLGETRPSWSKSEFSKRLSLFDRTIVDEPIVRARTPPVPLDESLNGLDLEPEYHDPTEEGMWLFHPKISELRKLWKFVVKIESHQDPDVSGRREGHVTTDQNAPALPLLKSYEPKVPVAFTDNKRRKRTESLTVNSLRNTKPRTGKRHAIIHGDRTGLIVIHLKTDVDDARVVEEGVDRKLGFYISKSHLCAVE